MRDHELTTLYVDFGHLLQKDEVLANAIQTKYYRFMPYLRRAVRNLVKKYTPEYLQANPLAAGNESINQQMKEGGTFRTHPHTRKRSVAALMKSRRKGFTPSSFNMSCRMRSLQVSKALCKYQKICRD